MVKLMILVSFEMIARNERACMLNIKYEVFMSQTIVNRFFLFRSGFWANLLLHVIDRDVPSLGISQIGVHHVS